MYLNGFEQERMLELDLDLVDTVLLRWFGLFRESDNMVSMEADGKRFYWIKHDALLADLPALRISTKKTIARRFLSYCEKGIFERHERRDGGTYTYYRATDLFYELWGLQKSRAGFQKPVPESEKPAALKNDKYTTKTPEEPKKAQSGPDGPLSLLDEPISFGNMDPKYFELLSSIISKGGFTNRLPTMAKPDVTKTILKAYRDLQALGQGTFPRREWNTDWLAKEKLNPLTLLPAMTFAELRKLCRTAAHWANGDRKNGADLTKDLSTFFYNPKYHKSKFLQYVAETAGRSVETRVSDTFSTWATDLYNKANAGWYDDVSNGYAEAWVKVAKALHAMTKENTDEVKRYLKENRALSNPLEHNRRAATPKTIVRLGAEFLASIRGGEFIPHPNAILPGAGSWTLCLEWLKQDPRFADIDFKLHEHSENVFPRMTVKVRQQLVAMDEEIDLSENGTYVSPKEWREMLESEEE